MDMRDPSLEGTESAKDQTLEPVSAETDAVNEELTVEDAAGNEEDPEAAVEEIMTEGEESVSEVLTPELMIEKAREMLGRDAADITAEEIRRLRQQFNMLRRPEAAPAAEGEDVEPVSDPEFARADVEFGDLLAAIREKKSEWTARQEAERAENLRRKNEIIEQIIALAEDTDNVNRTFPRYRELQDEFNAVGPVPPTDDTSVWKRFQEARERYSDNLKINKELRDYDFKKNLAEKEVILAEARGLAAIDDVIAAYHRLQDLHNQWRQIGPVAKELREEIWNNFRDASAEINKRYQAYFEARKAEEAQNEAAKTVLCERLEALDFSALRSFADWDAMTKTVIGLQEEWKTVGFAAKKANRQLFNRFRSTCDKFFTAKADYFRSTREELSRNLARKQELADKAEALKDSTDWNAATDTFVEMQKDWKTIGAVPKKYSDSLWKRFTAACDAFFEQKKKAGAGQRSAESANLKAKREIIGKLSALAECEDRDAAIEELRALQTQWQAVGHVPFREKDKIYEAYRSAVDAVRSRFDMIAARQRRRRFEEGVAEIEGDDNKLFRERERLARTVDARRAELRTYENNLGFLSSRSKSGDSLVRESMRRIERLKGDIAELEEKIKLLDGKLS